MRQASAVIDLDTGGGERFTLKLRANWPKKVVATEEYAPNFRLATERLAPLGVQVVDVRLTDDDPMPFAAGEFDLVLIGSAGCNTGMKWRGFSPRADAFLTRQNPWVMGG